MPEDESPVVLPRLASRKLIALTLMVALVALLYWQFHDYLRIDWFAERETALRDFESRWPWAVPILAFLIYAGVTGLSLPGATALTLVVSWYLGFWRALPIISFASTAGATLALILSRYLFRDWVQTRFSERLKAFNESLEKEGPFFLFSLRLIPVVPFFIINVVMGLTPIRVRTFWWVSQLGMLPGTLVYVYAGSSLPSLQSLADEGIAAVFTQRQLTQITLAFFFLAVFPFAARWMIQRVRGKHD